MKKTIRGEWIIKEGWMAIQKEARGLKYEERGRRAKRAKIRRGDKNGKERKRREREEEGEREQEPERRGRERERGEAKATDGPFKRRVPDPERNRKSVEFFFPPALACSRSSSQWGKTERRGGREGKGKNGDFGRQEKLAPPFDYFLIFFTMIEKIEDGIR
ncbi:hypothetical protein BDW42DRAFT_17362 [Aspergillus taichungensis]|uniref:Uncharacterized protein n=1 Tax=Aspergillus taichungensis TaxID=482145 RepID=A0A2J5HHX1_9EURO|nr:hypothetical protein BDW42DRAFT_17362 [Aspergillus taichungensis]